MRFRDKPTITPEEEKKQKEEITEQILAGADQPASSRGKKVINSTAKEPWEEIGEEKEVVVFSFRVPRRDMQKLKYVASETKMSINTICLSAIKLYNKKKLNELKKEI